MSTAQAATVQKVRYKPLDERTEMILDLDQAPQQLHINQAHPRQVSIQFEGKLAPTLASEHPAPKHRRNLQSVHLGSKNGKVQLILHRKATADLSVYALEQPHRLIISLGESYRTLQSRPVSPGVMHRQMRVSSAAGPLNINVLDVDLNHPEVTITPVLASQQVHGKARVTQMARFHQAVAGINASFFKPDAGTVLGTTILNRELITGPIFNRVCLGMTPDKKIRMARVGLNGRLIAPGGRPITIHNVNQPRLNAQEVILYSSRWATLAPNTPRDGVSVQISAQNEVLSLGTLRQAIPEGGYVLTGPKEVLESLLAPGDAVQFQLSTTPDWSDVVYAVSGGPYLVKNGELFVDTREQAFRSGAFTRPAPRTAVGITADNRLLMVTVDGRQKGVSIGMTLWEMAKLMKALGAVEAMNFDGGSSTQMVVHGHVVNAPTVRGGAAVGSALLVRQVPTSIDNEVIGTRPPGPASH